MTTFSDLALSDLLLDTLNAQGYERPTPIQAAAIPTILGGRDLLGCAQTGTGKTAAFALPIIQRLLAAKPGGSHRKHKHTRRPRALILAPTRELASQIGDSLRTYAAGTGLRHTVVYGGVKQSAQVRDLRAGVDVIVATPGRLLDLFGQGHLDLGAVETFVLDEADHMLDMGFVEPIRRIAGELPEERQTVLFSATMPPKIERLAKDMLREPEFVSVDPVASAAPSILQRLYHVADEHKHALLRHLLDDAALVRAVVFTRTKHGAEKLAKKLALDGVTAGAIHGNKTQAQRERGLSAFRKGRVRVLVATDVAARGLDVDGISHVINYNLPADPEAYVHRIGRTGRAGAAGEAISFCSRGERGSLRAIERLTGERIASMNAPVDLHAPRPAKPAADQQYAREAARESAPSDTPKPTVKRMKPSKHRASDRDANAPRPARSARAPRPDRRESGVDSGPRANKDHGHKPEQRAQSKPASKRSRRKAAATNNASERPGRGVTRPAAHSAGKPGKHASKRVNGRRAMMRSQ